jgi:hypothetical protein
VYYANTYSYEYGRKGRTFLHRLITATAGEIIWPPDTFNGNRNEGALEIFQTYAPNAYRRRPAS